MQIDIDAVSFPAPVQVFNVDAHSLPVTVSVIITTTHTTFGVFTATAPASLVCVQRCIDTCERWGR
jgi:hypothetical protein